jgi:NAD(P)-dependent dehydrogenase (short-subunit alcohol dehydrogenase family)
VTLIPNGTACGWHVACCRSISVARGPIWTPLIPSTTPAEHVEKFGENTPVGRAGQPVELAPVYVFLASTESSYITGEVIGATGGRPLG